MKVLFIGYVWPEPCSSAAGLRSLSLIQTFREVGWEIHFATSARENEHAEALRKSGISTHRVAPNEPIFDTWIAELCPDFVIFDRFMIEEQFGWRVREHSPTTVRILDTVDLHFLRRARQDALKSGLSLSEISECRFELVTADSLREVGAIYRSDCTLLISDFEMRLLTAQDGAFRVPPALVEEFGFCYSPAPCALSDELRHGFAVIGNFRHEPNSDGVRWLKRDIWPLIRKEIPDAQVDIYGAYPPREMMALSDPGTGFVVRGPAVDQYQTLQSHLVNLAPLRFGAGLKGKISDGWWSGTPCVTTSVGAEGMRGEKGTFGGIITDDPTEFASQACLLYRDTNARLAAQTEGVKVLREKFDHAHNSARLIRRMLALRSNLNEHRAANFVGRMLAHHLHQSTKYFSRWIELKEQRSLL